MGEREQALHCSSARLGSTTCQSAPVACRAARWSTARGFTQLKARQWVDTHSQRSTSIAMLLPVFQWLFMRVLRTRRWRAATRLWASFYASRNQYTEAPRIHRSLGPDLMSLATLQFLTASGELLSLGWNLNQI